MSKQIDITKPLSDEDRSYLQMMGRNDLIERSDAINSGDESRLDSSAGTAGPALAHNTSAEELLDLTPNTGDVNTGVQKHVGAGTSDSEQSIAELAKKLEDGYKKDELIAAAEARDLDTSGNKADLARRLAEHLTAQEAAGAVAADDDDDDEDNS